MLARKLLEADRFMPGHPLDTAGHVARLTFTVVALEVHEPSDILRWETRRRQAALQCRRFKVECVTLRSKTDESVRAISLYLKASGPLRAYACPS